jgi:hypothetical protein
VGFGPPGNTNRGIQSTHGKARQFEATAPSIGSVWYEKLPKGVGAPGYVKLPGRFSRKASTYHSGAGGETEPEDQRSEKTARHEFPLEGPNDTAFSGERNESAATRG